VVARCRRLVSEIVLWLQDDQGVDASIGVGAAGLLVYKGQLREHRFPWAKIIKIAYKRNKFTVRLRAGEVCPAVF